MGAKIQLFPPRATQKAVTMEINKMPADIKKLTIQFSGRKLASMVLALHARSDLAENIKAIDGINSDFRPEVRALMEDFTDAQMKTKPPVEMLATLDQDLRIVFPSIIEEAKVFMRARNVNISDDEAFNAFNIVVLLFCASAQANRPLLAMIQKMDASPLR